ncbi:hypothetical protein NE237_006085 [Protea cynaroides]|uniref:Uncharacterized protein n=1 Tax=Protea cynaroides TaxID=273540 RepID=A0A9Q0KLW1_9MAGN|nr:hypothetical protein NE237_006085 [Protea cynaroides]
MEGRGESSLYRSDTTQQGREEKNLREAVGMEADLVKKAFSLAMTVQSQGNQTYQYENHSSYSIFAFSGSGTVEDWFSGTSFGETSIGLKKLFPSLKSIGNNEIAQVNGKFFQQLQDLLKEETLNEEFQLSNETRWEDLLKNSKLRDEVRETVSENRKIVFTGYSSGGPIAIFATILFLQQNRIPALCVTFGSPLVGNHIFGHALRRENWAQYFVHFVMRYDIIPRVLLAPISSMREELQTILPCFDRNKLESKARSPEAFYSFCDIMRNALSVANYTACSFMGITNSLPQIITSFIDFSPYRPFGTYVFCTGEGRMFTLKNPDAILQLLSCSFRSDNAKAVIDVACRSFKEHLGYENEFKDNLGKEDVVDLELLDLQLPLYSGGASINGMKSIETAVKELGLSTRTMLCLSAARESEQKKQRNQERIDKNREKIEEDLRELKEYRDKCEMSEIGYYDAFKLQIKQEDYHANVTRLKLAGIWDEIIELLRCHELPDEFECREDWLELGTRFRRLMEPLDIANYYRFSMYLDTGPYMKPEEGSQPRPERYRYPQRWLEHANRKPAGYLDSCFWFEVEDLRIRINTSNQNENRDAAFENVKDRILELEENILRWFEEGQLRKDVFFEKSTFVKWWWELPESHRMQSRIAILMGGQGLQPFFFS